MKPVNHVAELLKCGPSHDSETKLIGAQLSDGGTSGRRDLETIGVRLWRSKSLRQFIKFCMVGGSGLFVDMGILYLLADPSWLALNITLSKICAAEVAMINNFVWNEFWTFRKRTTSLPASGGEGRGEVACCRNGLFNRFMVFNAFCGIGVALAVLLLHLFHTLIGWNLYLSNLSAIGFVTVWNFVMNAKFNWPTESSFHLNSMTRLKHTGGVKCSFPRKGMTQR